MGEGPKGMRKRTVWRRRRGGWELGCRGSMGARVYSHRPRTLEVVAVFALINYIDICSLGGLKADRKSPLLAKKKGLSYTYILIFINI